MKQYMVTEYEQSDFDEVKSKMTLERAVEVLSGLYRGLSYNLPGYSKVCGADLENFEVCCAIGVAVDALLERMKEDKSDGTTE